MPIGSLNPRNMVANRKMKKKIHNVVTFFSLLERTSTISIRPIVTSPSKNLTPYRAGSRLEEFMNNMKPDTKIST